MCKTIIPITLSVVLLLGLDGKAFAWPVNVTVSSGDGEQVIYKRGLLGNKETLVQDRLGDKFAAKRGIFGITKDSEAGLLGNGAKFHKGILGNSETDVHTMLGDSLKYHKNIFGWRRASVNVHGLSSLMDQVMGQSNPLPSGPPPDLPNFARPLSGQRPGSLPRLDPGMEANSPVMPREADNQDVLPLK